MAYVRPCDFEMSASDSIRWDVPKGRVQERVATHQLRILVVEGDPLIAFPLAWELERLGHQVVGTTGNGIAALALARHALPQLVLVDVDLRGPLDGILLATALQRELHIRSVFLTSQYGDESACREIALGLMIKLYLPESVAHCLESVRASLEGRHSPSIPHLMQVFPVRASDMTFESSKGRRLLDHPTP